MAGLQLFIAPLMAEVENQVAMGLLCLDYAVIFYGWTALQFNYGPINLYECPASPNIPKFLMAAGILQCLIIISLIVPCWLASWSLEGVKRKLFIGFNSFLGVVLLCIYVAGAVWTYSIISTVQHDDPLAYTYCVGDMYTFSAACIGITFGLVWITLVVLFFTTWYPKYIASGRSQYSEIGENA